MAREYLESTDRNAPVIANRFRVSRATRAIREFRSVAQALFDASKAIVLQTKDLKDLDQRENYKALCMSFIATSWDQRLIANMLIHLGRILGHDEPLVRVDDQRTYLPLLEELRASMTRQLVNGSVVEKEVVVDVDPSDDRAVP